MAETKKIKTALVSVFHKDGLDELLKKLPLFIDMVLIENIVDEFECAAREGEELDYEDIEDAAESLIHEIPYAGLGE